MISCEQYTSLFRLISAATTNANQIKTQPVYLGRGLITNNSAAIKFVKLYDIASGLVVGTTVPTITIGIPTLATVPFMFGYCFTKGLALATTGLITDADATAVAANDLGINLFFR